MYEKSITREHRTAFALLIDQSGSMSEMIEYDGRVMPKATAVALVTNQIIGELIERARRHDGVRDYYDVGILGYSGDGVKSLFTENVENPFVSISELSSRKVRVENRTIERVTPNGHNAPYTIKSPMWVEPIATGETPMYEVMCCIYNATKRWCTQHANANSFPPIVINITDGESTDCDAEGLLNISRKIRSLSTTDGEVFMINIHIASATTMPSTIFPTLKEVEAMSHRRAKELSYASSVMPEMFNELICDLRGVASGCDFVGVSYNSSIEELITILNIGTVSVKRA